MLYINPHFTYILTYLITTYVCPVHTFIDRRHVWACFDCSCFDAAIPDPACFTRPIGNVRHGEGMKYVNLQTSRGRSLLTMCDNIMQLSIHEAVSEVLMI